MENFERCLEQLIRLYVSYRERYVLCLPNGRIITPRRKGKSYCKLTDNVLRNHLQRKYSAAVFAGNRGSKFICFDVDDGSRETVAAITAELCRLGIPSEKIHISLSGSKGYHVEVFFSEIISTQRLKNLYLHVTSSLSLNMPRVEFRPTPGAAIKLPLSVHSKTGNICWYVNRDTLEPIESAEYILSVEPLHPNDALKALSLPAVKPTHVKAAPLKRVEAVHDAPGFDSVGIELTQKGTRHNVMRSIAVYQRAHGADTDTCRRVLEGWYSCQNPELIRSSPEQVHEDIEDIVSWVFSDQFALPMAAEKRNAAVISASQMRIALNQQPRSARRLTFLLLVRHRMREPRISAADASRVIGVSKKTIYTVLRQLAASGVVISKPGLRFHTEDQGFSAESNTRLVTHKSI